MKIFELMFGTPRGPLGALGGMIMARLTGPRCDWTIAFLDIQRTDRVLEVGCGSGVALQKASALASDGVVIGVDPSTVMIRQARKRNAAAIHEGRVKLEQASAMTLPFPDETFDKAFSVNSVQLWPDHVTGLREIRRVLKGGGRAAITFQPINVRAEEEIQLAGKNLLTWFTAAGFKQVQLEKEVRSGGSTPWFCVVGQKD
jgi:ubiquinone/menaquinone biosynthesis C-methylase UbiE